VSADRAKAELQRMLPVLKEQVLLALVRSAGGRVEIPVAEVDANAGQIMTMRIDQETRMFVLEVRSKL
jgi:hypothetical protein